MTFFRKLSSLRSSSRQPVRSGRRPSPKTTRRVRPLAEMLEDRLAPAINPFFDAMTGTLTLSLDAADHAYMTVDGANIDVGTTDGGFDVVNDQAGVLKIVVQDAAANLDQAATFSALGGSFTQNVTLAGIETANVHQLITGAVTGNAATVNVDDPGQIQDGIDLAAAGATVNVLAGAYTEAVHVNKSVTLLGANAGVNAGVGGFVRNPETELTGAFGVYVEEVAGRVGVDGVTIDGFTILNGVNLGSGYVNGIYFASGSDDAIVRNNIVTGTGALNSDGVLFQGTKVTNNNPLIQGNDISNWNVGIYIDRTDNLQVLGNRIHDNPWEGFHTNGGNNTLIQGNSILANGEGLDIAVTNVSSPPVVTLNNIIGNTVAGLRSYSNIMGATTKAENNFWGSPTGPRIDSNSGGGGDRIVEVLFGAVDYQPFLNHAAMPFEDRFTQANGTAPSRAWIEQSGFFTVQGTFPNTQLTAGAAGVNEASLVNLAVADAAVEADINYTADYGSAGLVARQRNGGLNEYWGGVVHSGGTSRAEIWKRVGGAWTRLTTTTLASAAASVGRWRFEVFGSELKLFLRGALVGSVTDTSLTAAGSVGVWGIMGAVFDDFHVGQTSPNVGQLPFDDDFTVGPSLSPFWVELAGDFTINAGQLEAGTAGANVAVLDHVSVADALVRADFVGLADGGWVGVTARHSLDDTDQYFAGVARNGTTTRAEIWRKLDGAWTMLASPVDLAGQTSGELRFEVVGNSLKLFVDNQLKLFTYDSALTAAGSVGVWVSNFNKLDDFHAESIVPQAATLPFSESWTGDPDGAQLSRNWTELMGNFSVNASEQLRVNTTGTSIAVLNGVSVADALVQARFDLVNDGWVAVTARHALDNSDQYFGGVVRSGSNTRAEIWRKLDGAWTLLGTEDPAGQTSGELRFEVFGNSLKLYIDGALKVFAFDSALTAGTVGISGSNGNLYYDFHADTL